MISYTHLTIGLKLHNAMRFERKTSEILTRHFHPIPPCLTKEEVDHRVIPFDTEEAATRTQQNSLVFFLLALGFAKDESELDKLSASSI